MAHVKAAYFQFLFKPILGLEKNTTDLLFFEHFTNKFNFNQLHFMHNYVLLSP